MCWQDDSIEAGDEDKKKKTSLTKKKEKGDRDTDKRQDNRIDRRRPLFFPLFQIVLERFLCLLLQGNFSGEKALLRGRRSKAARKAGVVLTDKT